MKKLLLTLTATSLLVGGFAQTASLPPVQLQGHPKCLFNEALQRTGITYPQLSEAYRQANTHTSTVLKTANVVYDIPVVFHVVYSASQPSFNLPDSVLLNQLQVLNDAFRKQHADTGKTRAFFKPIAADAQIQFHLATQDPTGAATTGITRTMSSRAYFGGTTPGDMDSLERVKSTAAGGIDPWPTDRYYNIWVCNMTDAQGQLSVLGYGLPPLNPMPPNWLPGSSAQLTGLKDGVVIQTHAVGSNNPLGAPVAAYYSRGRALVHETGHYLGLQHAFGGGDGYNPMCGTATQSDGLGDTPEASLLSFTPGSAPSLTKNSCGSGASDSLDLWENYMDYTVDSFQTLFTNDQAALMRSVMGNQRNLLVSPTAVAEVAQETVLPVYPNPASSFIQINYPGQVACARMLNVQGEVVRVFVGADAAAMRYDVSALPSGTYFLLLEGTDGSYKRGKFSVLR